MEPVRQKVVGLESEYENERREEREDRDRVEEREVTLLEPLDPLRPDEELRETLPSTRGMTMNATTL